MMDKLEIRTLKCSHGRPIDCECEECRIKELVEKCKEALKDLMYFKADKLNVTLIESPTITKASCIVDDEAIEPILKVVIPIIRKELEAELETARENILSQCAFDNQGICQEDGVESIRKEAYKEMGKNLFPKDYYPAHLKVWAETIKREQSYESTLTSFLRQLSENWEALKKGNLNELFGVPTTNVS